MSRPRPTAAALTLLATFCAPASAQELTTPAAEPQGFEGAQAVISYTPADFAAGRPNTARDMIDRLPGFTFDNGEDVRGFAGAAGNVLIDGQRPVIKTESLGDMLARIPISQVERIDLIRGGAPGIDMQGRTVVANVIRKSADGLQQVFTLRGLIYTETGHALPGWNYEATRRAGEHQLDLQLGRSISYDDSVGTATRTTVDAATGAVTLEDSFNEADGSVHNARVNYKGPLAGGVVSANGLLSTDEFKSESYYFNAATNQRFVNRSHNDRGEIGLNYLLPLGSRFELEAIALSKLAVGTGRNTGIGNDFSSLFEVEAEAGESIGRVVLRHPRSPALALEGGGEIAFNYRDQQVALTRNTARIDVPASDVLVEELRGEIFVQGTWRPSPRRSIEAGVRVEESTITVEDRTLALSGDGALERSFVYPKPRLLATWSPTERDQVRLRIEREVGQLDFRDFISNVNLNTSVLSAGNAELEPDKTWAYELALEKRFWGDGAAVLTLRHEEISDVVDLLPFPVFVDENGDGVPDDANGDGAPDQRLVAGTGNIGDGTNDVLHVALTLPLAKLGLEGGEIKVDALFEDGEVRDPLTGERRIISGQRPDDVSVTFRQDLPQRRMTFTLFWFKGWSERYFELEQVRALDLRDYWSVSLEYKPTERLTLEAGLDNFIPYSFSIARQQFTAPRDTGSLALVETEDRNSQVIASLRARLSFD